MAVVGRGSNKARSLLLEKIASSINATDTEIGHGELQEFLDKLSVEDAVKFASEFLQSTFGPPPSSGNETKTTTSSISLRPVVALSVRKMTSGEQEVRWYSSEELLNDNVAVSTTA